MGTTDLFVELIVIGIGALTWIVLFTFSIFGFDWVPTEQLFSVPALFPLLSFIYIIGIITDRLADVIFGNLWAPKILRKHYSSSTDEINDRRLIYNADQFLANLMEYGRSRLRIARGWAFNSGIILIAFNFFVNNQIPDSVVKNQLFVWGNLMIGLLALFSWYSWYQLTDAQYRRSKGEANFLRQKDKNKNSLKK